MFRSTFDKNAFLRGMARTLDIGCTTSSIRPCPAAEPEEVDLLALRTDWLAVGSTLSYAVARYHEEHDLGEQEK